MSLRPIRVDDVVHVRGGVGVHLGTPDNKCPTPERCRCLRLMTAVVAEIDDVYDDGVTLRFCADVYEESIELEDLIRCGDGCPVCAEEARHGQA